MGPFAFLALLRPYYRFTAKLLGQQQLASKFVLPFEVAWLANFVSLRTHVRAFNVEPHENFYSGELTLK